MSVSEAISIAALNAGVLSVILSVTMAYALHVWATTRERAAGVLEEANRINDLRVPTYYMSGYSLYDCSDAATGAKLVERLRQILKGFPEARVDGIPGTQSPSLATDLGKGQESYRILLSVFSCKLFPRASGPHVSAPVEVVRFDGLDEIRKWQGELQAVLRPLSFVLAMHHKDLERLVSEYDRDWIQQNGSHMISGAVELVKPLAVVDGLVEMLQQAVGVMHSAGKALAMAEAYRNSISLPRRAIRSAVVGGAVVLLAGVAYPLLCNYPCSLIAVLVPVLVYLSGFAVVAKRLW